MRFGLFYELQLPRPWQPDSELRSVHETLEQIELADRLGYDFAWMVEHHFLEEYSHCSAPEVLLGAASQRTRRIRLGHGIMVLPQRFNHTARVAERIATLDLLSHGRVEFGSGESTTEAELGGFGVARGTKREEWLEALGAAARMFVEEPFAGHDGTFLSMPPRNVIPKPLQKPHPPLWTACIKRESLAAAAEKGLGALTFSFVEPEDARKWVGEYYAALESQACVPVGFSVNPQVAMTMYVMCDADDARARMRGLDGHRFFARSLAYYFGVGSPAPGRTDLATELGLDLSRPRGAESAPERLDGAFGAVGSPDKVREVLRRYEAAGVDQILLIAQSGRIRHEHICESMELFAREVMPEFHERHERLEREKMQRLRPAIEQALARRESPRRAAPGYRIPPTAGPKPPVPPGR
ncbi:MULTISPECIES: LLM class flavin-dependent oxidoreductase [Streptomyces]|uniref:LLM class flavin-dependent oxidoreductase n=1 Tax=Streptomyces morookaense TaxID=1970 RepID=A0A7Y7AZW0_STRMO|nr:MULTISPECIES: LLM class flavin-dependent oxidoreductase [Streptomyces]MCC2276972.1 LLM class flavin-dependent oxidoreductase [Streptomyces sp. ET3-23]NVK76091.1 LLM class flavin-dependent oxidoreductase [Streptomyces morookaense]